MGMALRAGTERGASRACTGSPCLFRYRTRKSRDRENSFQRCHRRCKHFPMSFRPPLCHFDRRERSSAPKNTECIGFSSSVERRQGRGQPKIFAFGWVGLGVMATNASLVRGETPPGMDTEDSDAMDYRRAKISDFFEYMDIPYSRRTGSAHIQEHAPRDGPLLQQYHRVRRDPLATSGESHSFRCGGLDIEVGGISHMMKIR
uniref:Uncharacterized protein n=1 Tax=Candidatus Kentrum sp. SD TaxID=2126332 RepID=A0A450YDA6_9GAMM|nr:MAG: hypothetical protein BECKSD772F_GA0070984_104217 [Candidatus Kentron sp. SD]VFK44697.1 MAG: hypothetical protein BECKSD772E_GA0070983_104218 [Candidatus Kentron sp. SD]